MISRESVHAEGNLSLRPLVVCARLKWDYFPMQSQGSRHRIMIISVDIQYITGEALRDQLRESPASIQRRRYSIVCPTTCLISHVHLRTEFAEK